MVHLLALVAEVHCPLFLENNSMDTKSKSLNISIIATNDEMIKNLQQVFLINASADQFIYMTRIEKDLRLNRIDVDKSNILIIDSEKISQQDLDDIGLLNQERIHPIVIYLSTGWTQENLIDLMRAGINEIIHLPLNGTSKELLDAIERIRQKSYIASSYKAKGKVISFVSAKGGAGATLIAINLAYLLSDKYKRKVLYVDLHLQYGDAAYYLTDTSGPSNLAEIVSQPYMNSVTIASAAIQVADNYYLLPASNSIEKSSKIQPHHIDNLLTVSSAEYDFVILDISPSFDSVGMRALDRSDFIYVVAQPILNYLKALINLLGIFTELSYARQRIKVVMNKCDVDSGLSMDKVMDLIGRQVDANIPYDILAVDESINSGIPIVKTSKSSEVSIAIEELCEDLLGIERMPKNESVLSKILHLKVS
jgi:pilus assembly protein CpaE